jgi:hypothetical protein
MKRIVRRPGWLIVVEETDPDLEAGNRDRSDLGFTKGRSVDVYAAWATPFTLVHTAQRRIEPGYERPDVGTIMLFRHA